jgi:hypothetical protein
VGGILAGVTYLAARTELTNERPEFPEQKRDTTSFTILLQIFVLDLSNLLKYQKYILNLQYKHLLVQI